jgi:protein-S-isoprenylcysteine O-methyltransferase Ste14
MSATTRPPLYSIGQALVVPNWVVGPSYFVTFGILFALRIGAEERMMLEAFGDEYAEYTWRGPNCSCPEFGDLAY